MSNVEKLRIELFTLDKTIHWYEEKLIKCENKEEKETIISNILRIEKERNCILSAIDHIYRA